MKVIIGPKMSGKTHRLIELASGEKWAYIVVRNRMRAGEVHRRAQELGYDINFPITYDELLNRAERMGSVYRLYIDNVGEFLRATIGRGTVEGVSIGSGENDIEDLSSGPRPEPIYYEEE